MSQPGLAASPGGLSSNCGPPFAAVLPPRSVISGRVPAGREILPRETGSPDSPTAGISSVSASSVNDAFGGSVFGCTLGAGTDLTQEKVSPLQDETGIAIILEGSGCPVSSRSDVVALIVPKAARKAVWEAEMNKRLRHISSGIFSNLVIINHTDLQRGGEYQEKMERIKDMADAIVIDEAHHFRNPGTTGEGEKTRPSRYRKLYDICEGKQMFLLTATPINNRLIDLQHMMELFTHKQPDYFKDAPLGIHSLPGHFRTMEKELERLMERKEGGENVETNHVEASQVLSNDTLFQRLVVQRSRAYVKKSQQQNGGNVAMFPDREPPRVADYSVKKTYGKLLAKLEAAFSKVKPLFSLAIYYPLAFYKGPDTSIDPLEKGRQGQVVGLIRTQFLKRFESSAHAFETS